MFLFLLIISWGYRHGGWWGAYTMFLISGIALPAIFGSYQKAKQDRNPTLPDEHEYVAARTGTRVDPTRPNFNGRQR